MKQITASLPFETPSRAKVLRTLETLAIGTAGGLLFTGDGSGDLMALDAVTGRTLWHVYPGGTLTGAPMTYELGGRQYVITAVDSVLYAWALPLH